MRRYASIYLIVGLFLLGLMPNPLPGAQPQAIAAEKIKVVTSFTILADITRNIAGDHAEVVSVTKPGAEIHGYQPTPHDLVKASDADLILWNGLGLERWFRQFVEQHGVEAVPLHQVRDALGIPAAVVSSGVKPISIARGAYDGKPNPHAWMGLSDVMIYVDNIRDALSDIDPAHAADFRRNAETYKSRLAAVYAPLRDSIAGIPPESRMLVTCEGAFSYLARDLKLEEVYIWPVNADQIGTPQQVRQVIDAVRDHDVPAVFCESTVSSAPAEQIARETGARFGGVLYVDSLSRADGPVSTFLDLISVTVTTIGNGLAAAGDQ